MWIFCVKMLSCGSLRNFKESGGVGAKKSMERWSREVKLGYLYLPIWGKKSQKRFSEAVPNYLFAPPPRGRLVISSYTGEGRHYFLFETGPEGPELED